MGKAEQRRQDKARAQANTEERRRVVLQVYQACDAAGAQKLGELAARGVTSSCGEGCAHCCHLEVPVSRAEAETIVAHLATRPAEERAAIADRLRGWLAWYRTEYPALLASGMERADAFFRDAPACALLDGTRCSVYAVRPITCRNHHVSSPAQDCDPTVGTGEVAEMLQVAIATRDHVEVLQRAIRAQGGDYLASIHLLPEWLAHLLDVEREPWVGAPRLQLGR